MNKLRLRSRWRKAITGNESKRIRDLLFETQEKDEYIKLFDKISFTLGVLNIVACEYFLFNLPGWFWLWWSAVTILLLFARYYHFRSLNYEYFLLDFCYFTTGCMLINVYVFPLSIWLTNICYIYCLGPLLFAIPLWRNSLVFHDFDKITSVYIHILPSMMSYIRRFHGSYRCDWKVIQFQEIYSLWNTYTPLVKLKNCSLLRPMISIKSSLSIHEYLYAIIGYLVWQLLYFYKTEILDKSKLDVDPTKLTSLRWMANDMKNPFVAKVLKLCRKFGIYTQNEKPDATNMKTKLVFVFCQFLYTLCTFIPSYFVSGHSFLTLALIGIIFIVSVFNGAEFYIDVFSHRYQWQFQQSKRSSLLGSPAAPCYPLQVSRSNSISQETKDDLHLHSVEPEPSIAFTTSRSEGDLTPRDIDIDS